MTSTRACHAYLHAATWNVEFSAAARKQVREMETYEVRSCVRGHHVFKSVWNPIIGQQLVCKRETNNPTDVYAVAVMRGSTVVGHVPRKISAACARFLERKGTIQCTITGSRRSSEDLPQGGLEVPCTLKFQGEAKDVVKMRKLVVPIDTTPAPEPHQPSKKRKIDGDSDFVDVDAFVPSKPDTSKPWLTFRGITQTDADKVTIEARSWLNDKHIDFAQTLLQVQFGSVSGLKSTLGLTQHQQPPYRNSKALQVIHCKGNHWVVASSLGCVAKVEVFDSLYSSVDAPTKKLVRQLFGEEASIEKASGPKQVGGDDCGVFAIATCTSLAHGCHPHEFDIRHMRAHLVKCFENFCLTVFP